MGEYGKLCGWKIAGHRGRRTVRVGHSYQGGGGCVRPAGKTIGIGRCGLEVAARMMVFKEARECVEKINTNMSNVRALVLDLYEREGWAALGYPSWRDCVVAEFKNSQAYLYRQLEAA